MKFHLNDGFNRAPMIYETEFTAREQSENSFIDTSISFDVCNNHIDAGHDRLNAQPKPDRSREKKKL